MASGKDPPFAPANGVAGLDPRASQIVQFVSCQWRDRPEYECQAKLTARPQEPRDWTSARAPLRSQALGQLGRVKDPDGKPGVRCHDARCACSQILKRSLNCVSLQLTSAAE